MKMIDLIAMTVIVLFVVKGAKRGFWLTLGSLLGGFAAVAVSWFLHPVLKAWLRDEPDLVTGFQKTLLTPFLETCSPQGAQGVLLKLADVLNQSELPGFIKRMLLTSGDSPAGVLVTLNEATLSLISFIALLLGTTLIIQAAALLLDRVFKIPGLSFLNRVGGMVLGGSEGVFIIWVFLAVATPWIAFRPTGQLAESILAGGMTAWLYQHNYLLRLIDFTLK